MDQTLPAAMQIYTGSKLKILELLGSGIGPQAVSDAVGVDCSYVTQLLAEEQFAQEVTQLRFDRLKKASKLDSEYEDLELKLIEKLKDLLEYMVRPGEILAAIRIINGTKRRGAGVPQTAGINVSIVTLILPVKLVQRFKVNEQNQVVEVGDQRMTTIASNVLLNQIENDKLSVGQGNQNERPSEQTYLPARQSA